MKQSRAIFLAASLAMVWGLVAGPSSAQTAASFPSQPVRIISPFPAGSGPDVVARIVGEKLATSFRQGVIIDPRPGANGFLALGAVKQAPPSGYDLLLADIGHLAISPSLFKKLPYDPKADFTPIGGVYRTSFYVVE